MANGPEPGRASPGLVLGLRPKHGLLGRFSGQPAREARRGQRAVPARGPERGQGRKLEQPGLGENGVAAAPPLASIPVEAPAPALAAGGEALRRV